MNLPGLPDKALLRPDEVAEFFSVTERSVYNWCDAGLLESTVVGSGTMRIFRASVIKMVKDGKDRAAEAAPKLTQTRPGRRVLSKGVRQ